MGNVSKRFKYGRYYYLEHFLFVFLTELCLYITNRKIASVKITAMQMQGCRRQKCIIQPILINGHMEKK